MAPFAHVSPFRHRPTSVTPFTVKRKQVNPDVLVLHSASIAKEVPQPTQLARPIQPIQPEQPEQPEQQEQPPSTETEPLTKDAQNQVKKITQECQQWRHKYLLLANERDAFEKSCKEKAAREKEIVLLELKLLKEVHLEKIQALSSAMVQWQNKVASLRNQLKQHAIDEEPTEGETIGFVSSSFKEDAHFIKDAYRKAHQPETNRSLTNQQLWNSINSSVLALRKDTDHFQIWRSLATLPVNELARLAREDSERSLGQTGVSNTLKKALFGKVRSSKRNK
ncbi:hypothetical protein BDF14DRAFT_1790276 [Spinellus fusiger]|nr:hypothetical protein BDF14DRAFT_1790276 [Spinellus fusiger]